MSSEVINAFYLCRGKVFQYKQQLLNRFSSDHVPVQFGVDYSSKIKSIKSESEFEINQSTSSNKTNNLSPKFPDTKLRTDRKQETYEAVSKIEFQKSPPINRKLILISSTSPQEKKSKTESTSTKPNKNEISSPLSKIKKKDIQILIDKPEIVSQTSDNVSIQSLPNRPTNFYLSKNNMECQKNDQIPDLSSSFNQNIRVQEYIGNQSVSPISEPEVISNQYKKSAKEFSETIFKTSNMSSFERVSNQDKKSDTVDPTLVSVAQRAKSLMKPKSIQNRTVPINTVEIENEGAEESILSIKDRIKLFKDSLDQSVIPCSGRTQRQSTNRFKTQPLSFDDIARANAMILDQSEVASTIESPSITNSSETLIDFSEESNSSSNKNNDTQQSTEGLRKSNAILRTQSCLINQKPSISKSIPNEIVSSIKVQDFIKSCDKKEDCTTFKSPKNAVVSRKLTFKSKTEKEDKNNLVYGKKSHLTQPITKLDILNSNMNIEESKLSINDRISKMQKHGENSWKSRIGKELDVYSKPRPGSVAISTLQEQLHFSNDKWKTRVGQKDVEEFTALSRLKNSMRNHGVNKRFTIHGQPPSDNDSNEIFIIRLTKNSATNVVPRKLVIESDVIISDEQRPIFTLDDSTKCDTTASDIPLTVLQSQKVTVPHISDKSLSNFFNSSSSPERHSSSITHLPTSDDFDEIFLQSDLSLHINKRSVKPQRKQRQQSRNPLKKLNERSDIKNEYDEVLSGVAERELKRCQIENIQAKAGFVEEALAALSSKEDFSKVKLKRTDSSKLFEEFVSPYKNIMLISIKGRKNVQVRLVEPVASSINIGDSYLLSTEKHVFVFLGVCSNVIETNKANELGSWIAKSKEMNYSGVSDRPIIIKSNDLDSNSNYNQFWKYLNCDGPPLINHPGDVFEDEIYEHLIQRTNMVYKVVGNKLTPFDEYWGSPLKHKMLVDDQVLVFDFGTELYLWSGFKSEMKDKSHGKNLLKMLFSKGYNYEDCTINPFDPLPNDPMKIKPKNATSRPSWAIVGRLSQKGETTLFKEKFSDWPEMSRLIKSSMKTSLTDLNKSLHGDLQPIELGSLLSQSHPSMHLTIDGKSVGRGGKWKVIEDGILREFSVVTKNICMWHITDLEAVKVIPTRFGQFCSADAYIIRWDYELITHGRYSRNTKAGNLSSVFFFWQGVSTSITEKTASALLTINLDKDHVTQIRVKQHHESPAFCRLFDGSMVVYMGKHKFLTDLNPSTRLFILRGEIESEAHYVEVVCQSQSLRSRGVFFLLNNLKQRAYLWFGNLSSKESKLCARYCVKKLIAKKPVDMGISAGSIKLDEIDQGKEPRTFWEDMGIIKKWKPSHITESLELVRGWHASAVTGVFLLSEITYSLYPDSDQTIIPAFTVLQSSLYKAVQPALFLIWTPSQVFIWEGWTPQVSVKTGLSIGDNAGSGDDETDPSNMEIVPLRNRLAAEKLALLKSVNLWQQQSDRDIPATIVYAGLEPPCFQELFPFWELHDDARIVSQKNGHKMYDADSVQEVLNIYLTMTYPIERLRENPLPENVIASRIESYLTNEQFEDVFKITKEEFYNLSAWKQHEKKKEVNLF